MSKEVKVMTYKVIVALIEELTKLAEFGAASEAFRKDMNDTAKQLNKIKKHF
jgi:hypothetical protein|tara:strand:+ start:84 stop:239 length:156 start_codon:yes stop_codon:yes gene_type:complete